MTDPDLTLVVLAAGMGSRYGGLKQLEPVGPGGATLMDFAFHDARRAGFTGAVLVIRPEMDEVIGRFAAERSRAFPHITSVHQRLDDVPAGCTVPASRTKPWGTAQAVLAAAGAVRKPFAVLNADDFYGASAFAAVATFLAAQGPKPTPEWAVVGYRLKDTVPAGEKRGVNRAVCRTDAAGFLTTIEEVLDIEPRGEVFAGRNAAGTVTLSGNELVSMNLWALTPAVFDVLRSAFAAFLGSGRTEGAELLLPTVIGDAVARGLASVRVLDAKSEWLGVTHRADRAAVSDALQALVARGLYPERPW
ncbi:MAG: NTP transferase domain-containing protein [Gemmatimonadales bacterium]